MARISGKVRLGPYQKDVMDWLRTRKLPEVYNARVTEDNQPPHNAWPSILLALSIRGIIEMNYYDGIMTVVTINKPY